MSSHHSSTTHTSWHGRTHLAPLGVLLALALACPAWAQPQSEASPTAREKPPNAEKLIRILSPDGNPLATLPVKLSVRLHPQADSDTFRASLNGHDISGRFSGHGSQLRATVLPGDGLVEGLNRLRVRVRGPRHLEDVDRREFQFSTAVGDMQPISPVVKVDTRVATAPAGPFSIQVGDQPPYSSDTNPGANAFGLQIVALNRNDLSVDKPPVIGHQVFATSTTDACQPIVDFLNGQSLGKMVIVSATSQSGFCNKEVGAALAQFGANPEIAGVPADDPYTFLGVKGWGYDQGYQIIGGGLTGYFARDTYLNFTFLQPDYVKFAVAEGGVVIGGTNYPFHCCDGGFQVLVLDRASLAAISNNFYPTAQSNADAIFEQMAADLNAVGDGLLVIVKSVGQAFVPVGQIFAPMDGDIATFRAENGADDKVHGDITIRCRGRGADVVSATSGTFEISSKGTTVEIECPVADHPSYTGDWSWSHTGTKSRMGAFSMAKGVNLGGLPAAIKRVGGNPYVFQQLGPFDSYALVGAVSAGYKNAPAFPSSESSTSVVSGVETITANETGEIRGMLARGHRGGFYEPIASDFDLAAPVNYDLYTLAWQAPTAWPFPLQPNVALQVCQIGGTPTSAGLQAAYTYFDGILSPMSDLRASYNTYDADWMSKFDNELKNFKAGNGFSRQEFCIVRTELLTEVRWASEISDFFKTLSGILGDSSNAVPTYIDTIAADLEWATDPHQTSPVVIDVLKILGGLTAMASAADPEPFSKGALGVLSAAILSAANVASTKDGGPRNKIDFEAKNLEADSLAAFADVKTSLVQVSDLITSDYGKMKILGERLDKGDPIWKWSPDVTNFVKNALQLALRTHYYERLLPLVYEIQENLHVVVNSDLCVLQAPSSPSSVWYPSVNPSGGDAFSDQFAFAAPDDAPPPATLTDLLFRTPVESEKSLGVPKVRFFTEWLNHVKGCR